MKFPYGISDFETIITENYLYVDRTPFIPLLENVGHQLLFLRPRRFGKTLLLNMLENYYDIAKTDKFVSLFGNLAIRKNPTERKNHYFVMRWDFSSVLPQGDNQALKMSLFEHINNRIADCVERYQAWLKHPVNIKPNAVASFESLVAAINKTGYKLYLFIDEYDNFANEVMITQAENNKRYEELVMNEGLLKTVFKNIKIASSGNGLERVFMTGVSPVVMADMSSGYNVAVNIYLNDEFNELCGFTETEVRHILTEISVDLPQINIDKTLNLMRDFYNGYCFSEGKSACIYNPTLALYFFSAMQLRRTYPHKLLDDNLSMDKTRIRYFSQLPHGQAVIEAALANTLVIPELETRFSTERMFKQEHNQQSVASLLYYFGVLTMDGIVGLGDIKLRIPNLVIRRLYVERIQEYFFPQLEAQDFKQAAETFYLHGNLQPLCTFLETCFLSLSNRDYQYKYWSKEFALKMAFLVVLYNEKLYLMDSEIELDKQYADLSMIVRPDARHYGIRDHLLEFKFINLSDIQLNAEAVKKLSLAELENIPLVKTKLGEAKAQLQRYQPRIQSRLPTALQLTAVVSIGWERVVWQIVL